MPDDITPETTPPATTPDRSAAAGDKLWAALHARPDATAEDLANDAGIGRSTAAKILSRWVDDANVVRTPGPVQGKRPGASRFAITTPDAAPAATTPADAPGGATGPHSGTDGPEDRAAADDNVTADPDTAPPDAQPNDDHHLGDSETADAAIAAPIAVDRGEGGTPSAAPRARSRLVPGALHGMVEDYLRDHPDDELGPTKIGHDLGRSSGAVSNALERLVASGYAVRSNDRPKRYRLADPTADVAPEV